MLTLTSILIAVALSAPAQAFLLADGESILVQNGKVQSVIVTSDDASPTVRKAADEVASYLKQISGAEIRVVAEKQAPPGIRIDVGPTRNAQLYFPDSLIGDEERVLVRTVPGGVIICGGGDRGTLYAAYRFLESLGCRWLTPESENELIPQTRTVRLSNLNIDTRPAFTWRLFSASSPELETWGLKMGFNGLYQPETATANGGSFYWPREVPGVHSFAQIMPSSRYFQPHPEWYSLLNGKREAAGQLCVTAPGLVEEFAANVVRVFDADPSAQLISIGPNDGYDWCECPNCRQLDQKLCGGRTTKQGLARERPFMGDRLFWFSNEVAGRVGQKYPEKKLLVLAYIDYSEPPDSIRPVASVVPFLCHYAPADYSRPVAESFGKAETRGGRRCWNSDETGPGDNAGGWASFIASPQKTSSPLIVEMDVWGESQLERIVINSGKGVWSPIKPEKLLSRKPQWDTLVFHVPLAVMDSERKVQQLGFGGGDSQAWVAAIRLRE